MHLRHLHHAFLAEDLPHLNRGQLPQHPLRNEEGLPALDGDHHLDRGHHLDGDHHLDRDYHLDRDHHQGVEIAPAPVGRNGPGQIVDIASLEGKPLHQVQCSLAVTIDCKNLL